jgi:hypothetical protein
MPKDCVDNMGKCQGMKQRETLARIDDVDHRRHPMISYMRNMQLTVWQ